MKPKLQGYTMPAEWAPHSGCWMGWPGRDALWGPHLEGARADYARVARAIAAFEPVTMVADAAQAPGARAACGPGVRVITLPLDDSWLRDSGPTFLLDAHGRRAAVAFTFNSWGGKFTPFDQDAALGARIGAAVDVPVWRSELVVEGGGFCSDGEGTLIIAETCVLNANRNPGWTKAQVEEELCAMLGMEMIIWVPGDITDTATDGHVDGYLAYARPACLLLEVVADPADPRFAIMAENRKALEAATDARGRRLALLPIAEAPRSVVPPGEEAYCRSYINFYIANGAVIAPSYGVPEDAQVAATLRAAYPGREVVMVPLRDLFRGGGGIHCITQQEPRARVA
jgi:agmatine deiminase